MPPFMENRQMKKMQFLAVTLVSLLGSFVVMAADKPATQSTTDKPAVNKICAVEGGDHTVDPEFFTMYKGQKIGFCCKDCIKSFEEDPEAYIAKVKARKDGVK